ncbi:hypothetical protein [Porphyromonas gingivalis]|uniref:hypothetical protein n=1 Tax=Porphyromonas gingivalis TaxID=837 RepID=UPI000974FC38|nr:hypothetical protein [Porphyromonas gingivalis]SJL23401.1 hypothetical protein PGIN_11A_00683 [Porphyromonas gingivalis]
MEEERQQSPLEGLSEEALKHVHQLDEPIPIELQASYFRLSAEMRRRGIQLSENEVQDAEQLLFDPVLSDDIKKMTLLRLAITGNITVFRIIERYLESASDSMRPWALMAQLEARIGILSDLVDEKQLVITSGLGGHDGMMRFMAFLHTDKLQDFEHYQEELIEKELLYRIGKASGEVERLEMHNNYLLLTFLVPINYDLRNFFSSFIAECNQFGHFLSTTFIITNTQLLTPQGAQVALKKYAEENDLPATN